MAQCRPAAAAAAAASSSPGACTCAQHPALRSLPRARLPAEAEALLLEWGRNELEEKKVPKWLVYLKHRESGSSPPLSPSLASAASAP